MRRLAVCGSTGSIGISTLDVVSRHRSSFEIFALTAHTNVDGLAAQCRAWRPRYAVMAEVSAAERLRTTLATSVPETTVLAGASGLEQVATHPEVDYVMAAIVGGLAALFVGGLAVIFIMARRHRERQWGWRRW